MKVKLLTTDLAFSSFPLLASFSVSNHKQLLLVIMAQCQGIKAGRQQLYSWEKRCRRGRGQGWWLLKCAVA